MLLDERQELERRAGGPLLSPFPLAHEVRRHVEVVGKDRLTEVLPLPERLDLFRCQRLDGRQARLVKAS